MISLTLGWPSLVGSWPDSPFFIRAPDSCTGAKVNLLPGDVPKHPSCLIPSGSCQPLRMIYGQAQRKGKRRLERGLRNCDNSSAPKGQAGAGRLAQGVTVMVIKVLLASLSTARALLEELTKTFSSVIQGQQRVQTLLFGGSPIVLVPCLPVSASLSQNTAWEEVSRAGWVRGGDFEV